MVSRFKRLIERRFFHRRFLRIRGDGLPIADPKN